MIVIDDESTDESGRICNEYAAKDSRVRVIHQQNAGLSAARNAGINWAFANSNSEWITFVDSDDWVHEEYLEKLLKAAVENRAQISVGTFECRSDEEPTTADSRGGVRVWKTEEYFVEHNVNAVVAWGKLYSKDSFSQIRFPVGKIHEDEFTTHKLLFMSETVVLIEQPLYRYLSIKAVL